MAWKGGEDLNGSEEACEKEDGEKACGEENGKGLLALSGSRRGLNRERR